MSEPAVDVVVVGAGAAGLAAARDLVAGGASVRVLEARDRVGGRTLNARLASGDNVELGGQWLGPTQERAYALTRELGLETHPTHVTGDNLLILAGKRRRYGGTIPRLAPHVLLDSLQALRRIERMAKTVPVEAPWTAERAAEWDAQTVESWLRRNVRTAKARKLIGLAAKTTWGAEPAQMSMLYLLAYAGAAGGLEILFATEGGANQDRVIGGTQLLSEGLAERLGPGVVTLGAPVRGVAVTDGGVVVRATGGSAGDVEVTTRRVVVALPPQLAARLDYDPPMPPERDQLTQRTVGGTLTKCMCVYPAPFWRADGLTGEVVSDSHRVTIAFDNTPAPGTPGVLVGFVGGSDALPFAALEPAERRRVVTEAFTDFYGPAAAEPSEYLEQQWAEDEYSWGGPVSLMGTGTLTGFGHALRTPCGPIHWAGTETATEWTGYIEGALQSGERVAAEVLAAL